MRNFNVTSLLKFAAMLTLVAFVATSCKDDDDDTPPVLVEDGVYLSGTATGLTGLDLKAMMQDGRVEGEGFASLARVGMFEKFMYLGAGTFEIVEKAGAAETKYGVTSAGVTEYAQTGSDDVEGPVMTGTTEVNGTVVSITAAGFYHVVFDKTTSKLYFVKITKWGVIGDATELGWSGQYDMTPTTETASECEWTATDVILRERGGFKFRYNGGWKIATTEFTIFGNIGKGATNTEFLMGGGGFPFPTPEGKYTVKFNWKAATGWSYTTTKTGDVDPLPEYPENLYMIGDAVGDWNWDNTNLPMIPVHSKPYLFWKIIWINSTGGFKFSPVRAWNGDFGVTGAADANGIYAKGGDNISAPATAGYYMVVVNLETEQIAVVDPKVYLIGAAVGGDNAWSTANADVLFTVDNANDVVTLTKVLAATNELRMYAWFDAAAWFTDWWQSEFMILNGVIEFRGIGGDQARVPVTAGNQKIDLNFKTLTGTITTR
jgi:hypothetical protein